MQKINNSFNFGRSITDFWYHYSSRNKTIKDVLGREVNVDVPVKMPC